MKKKEGICSLWINERDLDSVYVPISKVCTYHNHPFKVQEGAEMNELVQSIKDNGLLQPLIVRKKNDDYELISGHRRKRALEILGVNDVPVTVLDISDNEADLMMVDSNLHREKLLPSEKAFAYKIRLEAMKHQGKGKDVTLSQVGTKKRSDQELADILGESRNQIARYIRLTNLIPQILKLVDEEKIAFTVGVELSFLTEDEQYELSAVMSLELCTPSLSQANLMKRMSQQKRLDMDMMYEILEQEKPNQREVIKIKADVLEPYFPKGYTPKQKTDLIEALVKEWSRNNL